MALALDGDFAPHALNLADAVLPESQKGGNEKDGSGDGAVFTDCNHFFDVGI